MEGYCLHCGEDIKEDDNGDGGTVWVHLFGSTVCYDHPLGSIEEGDTTTVATPDVPRALARRVERAIDTRYGLYPGRMDYETVEEYLARAARHVGVARGELLAHLDISEPDTPLWPPHWHGGDYGEDFTTEGD